MQKLIIALEREPEDESPEHSEKHTGSAPGYAEAVREVMKKAEGGWGWCCAKVTVKMGSREATQYLGNCSYFSAADFALHSGYFDDMVKEAIQELQKACPQPSA